jgi:hypothetical protein
MYLLDSNAIINYLNASLPGSAMRFMDKVVDTQSNISVITKMETLGYNFKSEFEKNIMELFISESTVYTINDDIVTQTINIRKRNKIKLPDSIIAATALVYGLILVTRNVTDFGNIDSLKIINPQDL